MPNEVTSKSTTKGDGLVIEVKGFFNLDVYTQFRNAFENQEKSYKRYAVNLQSCQGITSAGLGMLLLLRDFAKVEKDDLMIIHCPADVYNILRYSNFDQLFTILN